LKSIAHDSIPGLGQFLADYPQMRFRPRAGKPPVLRGRFAFTASHREAGSVEDAFELEIEIPFAFPQDVPLVTETGGRIPREADYHVHTSNGTLCLGSPLRIRQLLSQDATLTGFATNCLVPFLFAESQKLAGVGGFAFGELAHGLFGLLDDYVGLFELTEFSQAVEALRLLGMKKRRANKLRCPCGCGMRVGRCPFNTKLAKFRAIASRPWFRGEREAILETARRIRKRAALAQVAAA
jgi:hypothetical protein